MMDLDAPIPPAAPTYYAIVSDVTPSRATVSELYATAEAVVARLRRLGERCLDIAAVTSDRPLVVGERIWLRSVDRIYDAPQRRTLRRQVEDLRSACWLDAPVREMCDLALDTPIEGTGGALEIAAARERCAAMISAREVLS